MDGSSEIHTKKDGMDDVEKIQRLHQLSLNLKNELAKVVIGQEDTIEKLLIGLFAGGHCLLVGVPGLAKTLLVILFRKCLISVSVACSLLRI